MSSYDEPGMNGDGAIAGNGDDAMHSNGAERMHMHNESEGYPKSLQARKPSGAQAVRATVQPFTARLFGNDQVGNDMDGANGENKKKKKQIAQWPHDDYHEIQTRYYQVVDNAKMEEEPTPSYVHRPQDMPDIPTAVQNLSLAEFGNKAEDRAIGIVSTWIFDAGLIDELLLEAPTHKEDVDYDQDGRKAGGGTQKMDKEIVKLREQTARDLALINSRLNDGVAASGSEVQELVNAVEATKGDLARLNQLTTYISNGGDADKKHSFLLTNYPKLKTAINGRRNLARCFRELDFFSQIPSTCDRMREELNSCEWTDHEWTTIRDVCREHVELQIFLVEAEAGMKARMEKENGGREQEPAGYDHRGRPTRGIRKAGNSFRYVPKDNNHDSVDRFLNEHVKNVWEVGDEIRLRVLSGIGSALDLSRQDPAGMVALIEAVEVYESAADEYRRVHGGIDPTRSPINTRQKHRNSITDMRRAALEQIADDFQTRAMEVFNSMIDKVKEESNDQYGDNTAAEFNAVLRASQTLTYQIELVKRHMTPCFPPFWNVETLWMTCVAAVCSEHILHHIGGQKGSNLEFMTVTQLLDLVAWVESFREKVEESFPNLIQLNSRSDKKTNFTTMKELMKGKEIDMESAKENLSWVTNVLWDVHRLAQDQFILRTQDQTNQWLENVYSADHAKSQTTDGHLTTSLPEDVFALAGVQLRTIRERLTKKSGVLVDAVTIVFMAMQQKQRMTRNSFLRDLETCCAAANDFVRMTDQCDEIVEELLENTDLPPQDQQTVQEVANELMRQYTNDAKFAAQSVHRYIFEPIQETLGDRLFSEEWEADTTNEAALTIVRTIEDFMSDIDEWMEEVMVRKLVDGLVRASINYYIKKLLLKTDKPGKKDSCFVDTETAMKRISGDISEIRNFFQGMTESFPALQRVINAEFEIMTNIYAVLYLAANDGDDPQDHFPGIQKAIKNVDICRFMIGDLYHLVARDKEKAIYELFEKHEEELRAFEVNDTYVEDQFVDKSLQLDKIVVKVIGESKRRRPIKGDTLKAMEKTITKWGWRQGGGETMSDDDDFAVEENQQVHV